MNTPDGQTQQAQLVSTLYQFYRGKFWLFWRIMLPIIFLSFLLDIAILYSVFHNGTNALWVVSTSEGFSVTRYFQTGPTSESFFKFASSIFLLLGFSMFPLVLAVFQTHRGLDVASRDVWRQTLRRIRTILMTFLLLLVRVVIVLVPLLLGLLAVMSSPGVAVVFVLIFACIIVYFAVRWSLLYQGIIIEGLSASAVFRRSRELVRGKWWWFFGRYLFLLWASGVLIGLIFAITFLLLSIGNSEFVPIREALLSEQFFTIFCGIDIQFELNGEEIAFGDVSADLDGSPSFWAIGVILVVRTLLYAVLTPIWAILTTHLYLRRTGESGRTSE